MNKKSIISFCEENEPLLKLLQPISTFVLAFSVFSLPLMIKNTGFESVSVKGPVQVKGYIGISGRTETTISGEVMPL